MKLVAVGLLPLVLGFLVAGCFGSGHEKRHADATAVIRAVMKSKRGIGLSELFSKKPGTISCVIHGGGPAPGIRVPGKCASVVSFAGDGSAVVKFIETWDGHSFRGQGSPARAGLRHTWEFRVSAGRKVLRSRQYGDFPPQDVI